MSGNMSRKILVTGGCGWLGARRSCARCWRGDNVIATDLAISPAMWRDARDARAGIEVPGCRSGEWRQVIDLFSAHRPDAVVHTAAIVGVIQCAQLPTRALRVNVEGSINLFEAMRLSGVRVSTSAPRTYGDFLLARHRRGSSVKLVSIYGLTKLTTEHYGRVYSREHGLECINARTCWVYGPHLPRLRMPRTFVEAALRGEAFHQADGGDLAVDQVYIDDTVHGVRWRSTRTGIASNPTISPQASRQRFAMRPKPSIAPYRAQGSASATPRRIVMAASCSARQKGAPTFRAPGGTGYEPRFDLRRDRGDHRRDARQWPR